MRRTRIWTAGFWTASTLAVLAATWPARAQTVAQATTAETATAPATRAPAPSTASRIAIEQVARGLVHPWGLAFLPDGRMLATERPGRLRLVTRDGTLSPPVAGVPAVDGRGQGGLLDVVLDPAFATSRLVYFSFAEPRGEGRNATAVARGRLTETAAGARLDDVQVIFRQQPAFASSAHFGSRLVFDRTGALFVTVGDRYSQKDQAQNAGNHIGKVLRIAPSGGPAAGNPQRPGWAPEIWSIGHRNVQAAALDPTTGRLWTAEHGARGGDEVNSPEAGRNYGWPTITYGRDYSGASIGVGSAREGLEQPIYYWDPSIAPSGMAIYTGTLFPAWQGNLFVGALAGRHIARLVVRDGRIVGEERLLSDLGERIRDVRAGPDGALWLLTDSPDGRVLRIVPKS